MKKQTVLMALALFASLVFCNAAFAAKVTIKFAHGASTEHQFHIAAEEFKRILEEKSQGEIVVNIFPQGQLGSERDAIEGVRMGTLEMATVAAAGAMPSFVPQTAVLGIPYVLESRKQAYAVLDGEFGRMMSDLIGEKNMVNLCFWEVGFRQFSNNTRPIRTAENMKGLKIRVQESKVWMEFIKTLGAIPTPVSFGELYSALQQKVVDGQENPIATIYSMKYYEVQKYMTLDGHTYEAAAVLINPKFLEGLSEEHRGMVVEAAEEARDSQRAKLEELDAKWLDLIRQAGVEVEENPDLASFREATKDFYKNLDTIPESLALAFFEAAEKAK